MTTRVFLCAPYEGPETWALPDGEWANPQDPSRLPRPIFDAEDAAECFADDAWCGSGCEGDPTKKPVRVAVREPATGRRWVVTVTAEYEVTWTGREEEVVDDS